MVVEGKVNALACPFDSAMISEEEKAELTQWVCGTCTMRNPKLNTQCCACSVPKDVWQCKACTVFNPRPDEVSSPAVSTAAHTAIDIGFAGATAGTEVESKNNTAMSVMSVMSVVCQMCHTPDSVTPPPVHPALQGKCGVMMSHADVQQLCTADVVQKFERFSAMLSDPNNRDCPNPMGCDHRQIGALASPSMTCEKCNFTYCFEHSNAHPNQDCTQYERRIRAEVQATKQAVKALGAKPCPYCRVDTVKNSGCNHMTCSQCHNEWCWLCNKGINGNVGSHYDATNFAGCGGMQMQETATTGMTATILRRFMHFLGVLMFGVTGASVAFVGFLVTCTICLVCFPCVVKCTDGPESIKKLWFIVNCLIGFGPGVGLLCISLGITAGLWVGLLPLFVGLALNESCQGRSAVLKMLFLPFVLFGEKLLMFCS